MWTAHIAPVILRAMVDTHITLAWILKDPPERSRRFIFYGLGQVKLDIEHRKSSLGDREPDPQEKAVVKARED